MKKEFIPYEQALELKKLGFKEICLAWYHKGKLTFNEFYDLSDINEHPRNSSAPLYQQAFRWFREKYEYIPHVFRNSTSGKYSWKIDDRYSYVDYTADIFNTYEEAELACLKKLIEIVKK